MPRLTLITLLLLTACADETRVRQQRINLELRGVAQDMANELDKAVEVYRQVFGRYPTTDEGLEALTRPLADGKPLLRRIPDDPWNRRWVYQQPGRHNRNRFDVTSTGVDGRLDTDDDVGNW